MAKTKEEKELKLEPVKKTILTVELIGTSDLILNKKARSYELTEVYRQTHPKGTKIPDKYNQDYNLWEHLITSITWQNPIEYFDDDYSKYTEEMWANLMRTNHPCVLSLGLKKAMVEVFKTFGFKDSTGKDGTDLKRGLSFTSDKFPITFDSVSYERKLVPTGGLRSVNVVTQYNLFHGWKCKVTLACADVAMPPETIINLLSTTGNFIGIGTQRMNGFGHWKLGEIEQVNA